VTVRTRRTSAEVRHLILTSARDLFAANGYRGTSTREIAQRAGVAEVLLFRNFGSKAELYSSAVLLPLTEFLDEWMASDWSVWDEKETVEQQREFVARLYEIVVRNRGLIMSYLAMSAFEPELITSLQHARELGDALDRLADRAGQQLHRLGYHGPNVRVGTRAVIAMIVGMALSDGFGATTSRATTTRDEVIDEMTQLIVHGSFHREP
jgi:AcrR family transcriptional regulator